MCELERHSPSRPGTGKGKDHQKGTVRELFTKSVMILAHDFYESEISKSLTLLMM